jgi:membrane protein required for colicin V production
LNAFDVGLLAVACLLVLVGMWKGLVRILIGLAALVAAFALAARFHQPFAERLDGLALGSGPSRLLAYVAIFLGVMLAGGLAAFLVRKLLKAAMLSWADRLAGATLGLVVAMTGAALLVLPLVAYSPQSERILGRSVLAPYVSVVADLANALVPDDLSERYETGIEELRRQWRERWFRHAGPEEPPRA